MFFKYAFLENRWLWFHLLAGGILAKFLLAYLDSTTTLALIVVASFAWEVVELVTRNVEQIYGSKKRFFMDAAGDIIGAVVMAAVVVM